MLKLEDYMKDFNNCLMREPPFCAAACPFHINISDFAEKTEKGMYNTAFKTYRNAVGFPRLVSQICPAPCKDVCPWDDYSAPIALRSMERSVIALANDTRPNDYNIPPRNKKIAIIGAGISGMGCALRMAAKKYHVEIFERNAEIGGSIAHTAYADIFLQDVEEQFQYEEYILHLNRSINDRSELNAMGFDAVYVATGKDGDDFGLLAAVGENGDRYCLTDEAISNSKEAASPSSQTPPSGDPSTHNTPSGGSVMRNTPPGDSATRNIPSSDSAVRNVLSGRAGLGDGKAAGKIGWFAGGSLIGHDGIYALADGLLMGNVLDAFLKTGNLLWPQNKFETKMYFNPAKPKRAGAGKKHASQIEQAGSGAECAPQIEQAGSGAECASQLKQAETRTERISQPKRGRVCEDEVSEDSCRLLTEAELKQEARRCFRCQCDSCRMFCDLTNFFNKWPPRIRDEVFATTLPGTAEVKATPAKRLMSTCNQCGICKEVCPENIDMNSLILAGRQSMHRQGKAPWVFHDFWVQDMEFSDGEAAHLIRMPDRETVRPVGMHDEKTLRPIQMPNGETVRPIGMPDKEIVRPIGMPDGETVRPIEMLDEETVRPIGMPDGAANTDSFVFFPGCQIGASDPDLVLRTYDALRTYKADIGIFLRCCGAPAEWSGDDEKHRASIQSVMDDWRQLGKPTLLAACPTCIKKFREYMPEIPIVSVYEKLDEWHIAKVLNARTAASRTTPGAGAAATSDTITNAASGDAEPARAWAVFDPCSARHKESMKHAVRSLAQKSRVSLEPLPEQDDIARCCGFGGQPAIANPEYAEFVAKKRIAESDLPYITYCINCRDIFAEMGKESKHILEILFPPVAAKSSNAENANALAEAHLDAGAHGTVKSSNVMNTDALVAARSNTGAHSNANSDTGASSAAASINRPTVTERRNNRIYLKRTLLKTYWGEDMQIREMNYDFELIINDDIKAKMHAQRVLESELYEVTDFLRQTGRTVKDKETGVHSGYKQVGHMTYWVNYRETEQPGRLLVVNVYTHRMSVDLENMWNGVRPESYLRGGETYEERHAGQGTSATLAKEAKEQRHAGQDTDAPLTEETKEQRHAGQGADASLTEETKEDVAHIGKGERDSES